MNQLLGSLKKLWVCDFSFQCILQNLLFRLLRNFFHSCVVHTYVEQVLSNQYNLESSFNSFTYDIASSIRNDTSCWSPCLSTSELMCQVDIGEQLMSNVDHEARLQWQYLLQAYYCVGAVSRAAHCSWLVASTILLNTNEISMDQSWMIVWMDR